MKQNYALLCLSLSLIISSFTLDAQNQAQIEEIKKKTNLTKLQQLESKFKLEQDQQRSKALQLAAVNNWRITYIEDGVFYGLVGVTDDNKPIYYRTDNTDAAESTRADWLHNDGGLGLDIEGQGMTVHVWDGGLARVTHQEYDGDGGTNRFSNGDSGGMNFHAAHVMGTIIASGFQPSAKGMAPKARGVGYDWNSDLTEATAAAANGMLISNHSYGFGAEDLPDSDFGKYSNFSRGWDELMYNAPYYLMVVSAGNDGNDNTSNGNPLEANPFFDKLSHNKTAKNNMVVANGRDANIDSNGDLVSVTINTSSSEGPTDDLRIKPDIMGNGTSVLSTFETADDAYNILSGTSMAAPNVAGSLLLLQQYYDQVNGVFMRASTLKGLALHTTDDVGVSGPDAQHGWGLMNTKRAAETITNNGLQSWIEERVLEEGQTYSITVKSDGTSPLLASISWTDLPGEVLGGANNATPVLVNDLDIRVTQESDTFLPWRLTGVLTNDKGDNLVDPYERVEVDGASGEYTITVSHKGTLTGGPQAFALIVTGVESNFTFSTSDSSKIVCSDVDATFDFDYQQIGSTTTNFSAQNLPTGVTASFSSPSLSESGSTTLTLGGLSGVPAGEYEITVVGDDGDETESRVITLRLYHPNFDNNPMVISSPVNESNDALAPQTTLEWELNVNAVDYEIEVSDNPSFSNIVASGNETDGDLTVTGLMQNTVYYWRIRPSNQCTAGEYSETYSFQTGIEECNNTYSATDFSNAEITLSPNNTAYVPISITDDITISRLIVQADVTHEAVEDLRLFIQQPAALGSNNTTLLDRVCDDTDNIIGVTFDDEGGSVVCNTEAPAVTGVIAPVQSLAGSSGLSSLGTWFFAVTDNALFDGGTIDAASITVCGAVPNTTVPSFTNNTIDVAANGTYTIQTSDLEASTSSEDADAQTYTLVELPERGTLRRNGSDLSIGDTFTQEDINTGLVSYRNTQTELFSDTFKVNITNGAGGWLPNQVVNVSASIVSADSFELNNFSVFPNPSQGMISVRFESRTNNTVNIQVFDLQGRAIFNQNYDSNESVFEQRINIGNLANGVYLVRVNQGDRSTVKNLIISK